MPMMSVWFPALLYVAQVPAPMTDMMITIMK